MTFLVTFALTIVLVNMLVPLVERRSHNNMLILASFMILFVFSLARVTQLVL